MKATSWSYDLLKLVFQNQSASQIGDPVGLRGSLASGFLYVSLHTNDPAFDGSQNAAEATFGGYKRLAVPRMESQWKIEQDDESLLCRVSNSVRLDFPEATSGSDKISHIGIGANVSGVGKLMYSGTLKQARFVEEGIILSFKPGQIVLTEK